MSKRLVAYEKKIWQYGTPGIPGNFVLDASLNGSAVIRALNPMEDFNPEPQIRIRDLDGLRALHEAVSEALSIAEKEMEGNK